MSKYLSRAIVFSALAASLIACQQESPSTATRAELGTPDEGSVPFDITPVRSNAGTQQWLAKYSANGQAATFRIEFGATKPSSGISFGHGKLIAQPGSDARALLDNLKKALEAKNLPHHVQRVSELPFDFAIIGDRLSHAAGGGFNAEPTGDWTATKIFLAKGEAEVFLNTNPVAGKAEFSIKDPDYGDQVLAELAKVL